MPQADTDTLVRYVTPILYLPENTRPWVTVTRLLCEVQTGSNSDEQPRLEGHKGCSTHLNGTEA